LKASEDDMGGTPGRINSVNKSNTDTIPPFISDFKIISPFEINLYFSEPWIALYHLKEILLLSMI
jgi:hypothetical protein